MDIVGDITDHDALVKYTIDATPQDIDDILTELKSYMKGINYNRELYNALQMYK